MRVATHESGWLSEAFSQIAADAPRDGSVEDNLDLAGQRIRIRYQDMPLADALGRSMGHLRSVSRGLPDLTIDCWTAANPLTELPPAAPAGIMYAQGDDGRAIIWDGYNGPLFAYDRSRRRAWARFREPDGPASWERANPFRHILGWWAAERGLHLAHAAAVGIPTAGVLLVGRGGSGKSTTALACLEAGLGFAGDDACLLAGGQPPWVHGLYLSAKGDANSAALLPGCRNELTQSTLRVDDKSVVFADRLRPDAISVGFPLRGIVVLRFGGGGSSLAPLSPAAGLRALAPSTMLQGTGNRVDGLAGLARIVRGIPTWELTLGPDPATAADLVRQLLDRPDQA